MMRRFLRWLVEVFGPPLPNDRPREVDLLGPRIMKIVDDEMRTMPESGPVVVDEDSLTRVVRFRGPRGMTELPYLTIACLADDIDSLDTLVRINVRCVA